jgi:acetyltransferase-like isoleucine patch superfamily enzyme
MKTYNGDFLPRAKLAKLGILCGGPDVKVHGSVVIINPERLTLGNHVRIDPFCILSATGEINIGSYVHISGHCSLVGEAGIEVEDFVSISHGAKIFSVSDAGRGYLVGPMVPVELRNVTRGRVHLMRYAVVGAGAVVMPGVIVEEGSVIGALSLARRNVPAWTIWSGVPARRIKTRNRDFVRLAERLTEAGD